MAGATRDIAGTIRTLYERDPRSAPETVEAYLQEILAGRSLAEKRAAVQELAREFGARQAKTDGPTPGGGEQMARFVSLVLGYPVAVGDIGDEQLQEKLNAALQAIFTGLNELLEAIATTLGQTDNLDQTIRQVVRGSLDQTAPEKELAAYVDQIKQSFFVSYESCKAAHQEIMGRVLAELDPEALRQGGKSGLKFGPLRKAELFEQYEKTFRDVSSWHNSGRGLEEYLRAFEKACGAVSR